MAAHVAVEGEGPLLTSSLALRRHCQRMFPRHNPPIFLLKRLFEYLLKCDIFVIKNL